MTIPVILLLPSSTANSAMSMAADGGTTGGDLPEGFTLDPEYPMIEIGDQTTQASLVASVGDDGSGEAKVAVRGFLETTLDDVPETLGGHPVFSDPEIAPFLTCGNDPPVGAHADVATLLEVQTLWDRGMTGENVAVAIMDTGINLAHIEAKLGSAPIFDSANSWAKPGSPHNPGEYPVDHGTMCAYDALIAAPWATLLDFPILFSVSGIQAVLSNALLTFSKILTERTNGSLTGYSGVVISNSWGVFHPSWDFKPGHPGRYIDNPNHPFMLQLEALARSGIDIFFAAGNCGADCPDGRCQNVTTETIRGASASIDVFSVAGCDTSDTRVGYSSQGPSIPGIPPGTKPDITAYTHFLGSEAFGTGQPDSGTSAACPVAAGCMAALRTKISPDVAGADWKNTYLLFDHFRQNAAIPAGLAAGWNGDYGYGIIRPVPVADAFGP
jgi:Subtilase family